MDLPSSSAPSDDADRVPTHFLMELVTLDHLMMTTSSSRRSKLTCIAVSPQFLIMGTSTGGVSVYGRYSTSRKRRNAPSGPLHFINTKDGAVSTLCMAPKEGLLAVGSESGRVHVVDFSTSPSPVKHLLTREIRKLKKVTCLVWSADSKRLYSGHANGVVFVHYLDAKYIFRSSCAEVATFADGEILQLDVHGPHLLVSSQSGAYICTADDRTTIQIGKKPRSGLMGACFVEQSCERSRPSSDTFVLAARPNGRVWEANFAGVVYRTHQLRENASFSRPAIISLRNNYECAREVVEPAAVTDGNLTLGALHRITVEGLNFILSVSGSRIIVFDVEQSKVVLVNDLKEDICCCCICGSDIFLLLQDVAVPRKYTICSRASVVDRLQAKSLHVQCAQFLLHYKNCSWPSDLIRITVGSLPQPCGEVKVERIRMQLYELLEKNGVHSSSDCRGDQKAASPCPSRGDEGKANTETNGVGQQRISSVRSCSFENINEACGAVRKRASFPRSAADLYEGVGLVQRTFKLRSGEVEKAKAVVDAHRRIIGSESLRTLLQMQSPQVVDAVHFMPTVTVGNAAKSLAELVIATPASFSYIVPSDDLPAVSAKESIVVKRRTGPSIVKAVKPHKVRPVASVRPMASGQLIRLPTEEALDADHNLLNANGVEIVLPSSENNEFVCSFHDDENNAAVTDARWVIDRIAHLRLNNVSTGLSTTPQTKGTGVLVSVDNAQAMSPSAAVAQNEHCMHCDIHISWLVAAMMATVCRRINLCYSSFNSGAVPVEREHWRKLLLYRFTSQNVGKAPCARCETALSRCLGLLRKCQESLDLAPSCARPNHRRTFERCTSVDDERIRSILFDSHLIQSSVRISTTSVENGAHLDSPSSPAVVSNAYPTQRQHIEHPGENRVQDRLDWVLAIDARIVFIIASVVIGYHELMSALKESSLLVGCLSAEHWSSLSFLCVREQTMKKDEINEEVMSDLLRSLNLSTFSVNPLGTANLSTRGGSHSQTPMYSWIIDRNGSCPVCTASLKSELGDRNVSVTSFICGHAYHTLCLTRRFGGCLVCLGRMKNANTSRSSHVSRL